MSRPVGTIFHLQNERKSNSLSFSVLRITHTYSGVLNFAAQYIHASKPLQPIFLENVFRIIFPTCWSKMRIYSSYTLLRFAINTRRRHSGKNNYPRLLFCSVHASMVYDHILPLWQKSKIKKRTKTCRTNFHCSLQN